MPQIRVVKNKNWIEIKSAAEISTSDKLRTGKYAGLPQGSIDPIIHPDGYFKCPENPKGIGWNGEKFFLIIIDEDEKEKAVKIKDKISKPIPLISGSFEIVEMGKYLVDVLALTDREVYDKNKEIYRVKKIDKVKLIDRSEENIKLAVI